jgi:opacity protein-like surface antigen
MRTVKTLGLLLSTGLLAPSSVALAQSLTLQPVANPIPTGTVASSSTAAQNSTETLGAPMTRRRPLEHEGFQWAMQWNMGLPLFDTSDFNSDFSFRGLSLDLRYRLKPRFSVGVASAWQVFADKELRTDTVDQVTVTGVQIRHTNIVPILATATYHLPVLDAAEVYGTLGIGAFYVERLLELGALVSRSDKTWHFGLAPEIGFVFPTKLFSPMASVRWNFVIEGSDVPFQSYLNFNIGFLFF